MTDDPLGPLRETPLPPLAPAAALRARGEQRRRRQRFAVAGATALTLALVGVTGAALTGGADELRPAPFAGESPETDALWDALLDPKDVEPVLGGAWDDLRGGESSFSPQLEGCPATAAAFPSSARFLTDGTTVLGQGISLYADSAASDAAFQELLSSLRACGESSPAYELFDSGAQVMSRVFGQQLVQGEPTRPFSVERVGRAVVTLVLEGRPELDPALTEAAAQEVRETLGEPVDGPTPIRSSAPGPWSTADALLSPEQAGAAEQPGWTVSASFVADDDSPVADPCGEEKVPVAEGRREQTERAMGSTREAGGSSLVQEVYRYDSAASAERAFAAYEQQYARCASAPNPDAGGPGWTTRSEVMDREVGPAGRRLLVRRIPCSPEGACTEHFSTYEIVVQQADGVSVVGYTIGEDGDPIEWARPLVVAVQERLRAVAGG